MLTSAPKSLSIIKAIFNFVKDVRLRGQLLSRDFRNCYMIPLRLAFHCCWSDARLTTSYDFGGDGYEHYCAEGLKNQNATGDERMGD